MIRRITITSCCMVALCLGMSLGVSGKNPKVAPSFAWTVSDPLGLRLPATIDTLHLNYGQTMVPSLRSNAWATTGNYGAEGQNQIFFDRKDGSQFFFEDALSTWLTSVENQTYYNTRIPMTLLSYTTGGNKYSNQDRTTGVFSGNVNKRIELGAAMDYIYSKGSYNYQADKDFSWRLFGSYMGDRYEFQGFFSNYNFLNKESGGITDDRYITDPAAVQGGDTRVDDKSIPTRLTAAHSRVTGTEVYMNHRYKVGYYRYKRDSVADTIIGKDYVPVTSFIWTFDYKNNSHKFLNTSGAEDTTYFANTYLGLGGTNEVTKYWHVRNTVGVSMLEGFNKYAKFGFAVYGTHEVRRFTQVGDTLAGRTVEGLTKLDWAGPGVKTQNLVRVGGQLTKQHGSLLTYDAKAEFGVVGDAKGEIDVNGGVGTKFKMLGDTVRIKGYGYFKNMNVPYLLTSYLSNHYEWQNDFDKVRRFRVGGELVVPFSGTRINVGYETLKNYVFFNTNALPEQCGSIVNVLSATLEQKLHFGVFNWDNTVTYQTTSKDEVLALPKIALYSNMYLHFTVAKVLKMQFGVDCNYYTSYYAPGYNPSNMTFHNQRDMKCGNFAFMNAYLNCRMKQARFFVMYSHVNDGLFGGTNYFSMPHYPLNPGRFQMGVSVNFVN